MVKVAWDLVVVVRRVAVKEVATDSKKMAKLKYRDSGDPFSKISSSESEIS
jgi:hypothetical protein